MHPKVGLTCAMPSTYGPLDQCISGLKLLLQHRVKKAKPITPPILRNLLLSPPSTLLCQTHQNTLTASKRALVQSASGHSSEAISAKVNQSLATVC